MGSTGVCRKPGMEWNGMEYNLFHGILKTWNGILKIWNGIWNRIWNRIWKKLRMNYRTVPVRI